MSFIFYWKVGRNELVPEASGKNEAKGQNFSHLKFTVKKQIVN